MSTNRVPGVPSTSTQKTVLEYSVTVGDIKIKKAVRENDITNKLLKLSNAVIPTFLCNILNSCIHQGEFPNSLKIAEVVPFFKKGDSNLLTNYRPISILSQLSKIFEKLIFTRINNYPEKYHLISDKQFGFRQNSSTLSCYQQYL